LQNVSKSTMTNRSAAGYMFTRVHTDTHNCNVLFTLADLSADKGDRQISWTGT